MKTMKKTENGPRRVGARGLQKTVETARRCRPGALTGRVFKQEPSRNNVAGKPQMNTDLPRRCASTAGQHRFGGKMSFTIAQSASRKGDAPRVQSERGLICVHLCPSVVSMPERCHSASK